MHFILNLLTQFRINLFAYDWRTLAMEPKKRISEVVENGFSVINSYFNPTLIKRLGKEFDTLIAKHSRNEKSSNGVIRSVKLEALKSDNFQATFDVMNDTNLISILTGFYKRIYDLDIDKEPFDKVDLEYNAVPGKSVNSDYHFDRIPSVKCQIYLNDVGQNNGALSVIPKSQSSSRRIAMEMLESNSNPLFLKNFLKKNIAPTQLLTGVAGTLTIFDTMVLHKGGEITDGFRKTIRLVKWPPCLDKKYYLFQNTSKSIKFYSENFYHPKSNEDKTRVNPRFIYQNN